MMACEVNAFRLQPLGVALELRCGFRPQQSLRPHGVEHLFRRGIAWALLRDSPLCLADGLQRLLVGVGVSRLKGIPCLRSICLQKARVTDETSKPKSSAMVPTTRFVDSSALTVADVVPIAASFDEDGAYATMSCMRERTFDCARVRCEAFLLAPARVHSKYETPA